jgi:hypothetical protein
MKTLKFALIAALVACTMVSLSYADGLKEKPKPLKVVNLSLEKAIHVPGLIVAMYAQINEDELLKNIQHMYVAEVTFQNTLYRISGTFGQWARFFRMKIDFPVNEEYPAPIR